MRRSRSFVSIARTAAILSIGTLILILPSCKTKRPVTPAPPAAEAPVETPTPPQPPQVDEKPLAPIQEPSDEGADIDDTIKSQNATRSILKTVYFDFDKADVRDDQLPILQANAAWMKQHAQYRLLVEGHCDERDTIEYNLALGDRRAKSIQKYLVDLGVPADRVRTISYGEERPADPGHDEDAYARNRRGEFTLEK